MSRGPSTFKARDVKAAALAARQAGIPIQRIEIGRDGVIKIIAGKPESPGKPDDKNEWDGLLDGENTLAPR